MNSNDGLVKILVDLPNLGTGESMWARPLGSDLYELHNTPFYAYGLSYLDVVYAQADGPDHKPAVKRLERSSGRRTLRVLFEESASKSERIPLLNRLDQYGVTWEGASHGLFALDIPSNSDYQAVCDQLWKWEQDGLLQYETCECRIDGSFDGEPRDD